MTTYFISGHLDLSADELAENYAPRIVQAVAEGASFVVGDAGGCDAMAQQLLRAAGCERVRVFHMFEAPRNNAGFPTVGGFRSDRERDEALTSASEADLAWVRPGREKSGTAKNLKRRAR